MDLFEYQGKQFFKQFGMPVSDGEVAFTVQEAVNAAEQLGTPVMVKAQVHSGGRGKAGGVKFAATIDDVQEHATNILGLDINGHGSKKPAISPRSTTPASPSTDPQKSTSECFPPKEASK